MLEIETRGTWYEQGTQLGEAFRDDWQRCLDYYAAWLRDDFDTYRPAVDKLRARAQAECPHVIDESRGVADALDWKPDFTFGFRVFNEVKYFMPGCSGLYLADSEHGPLIARTCDLETDISGEIQLCRIVRSPDGPDMVTTTYLPVIGTVGFNADGVGLIGSSAASHGEPPESGAAISFLNMRMLSQCASLDDALDLTRDVTVCGKGAIQVAGDAHGASAILEYATGRPVMQTPRRDDRVWQACTNFCISPGIKPLAGPTYLGNAYARYGYMMHHLDERDPPRTVDAVKQLLTELAQPGAVCEADHCWFNTVYAWVVELKHGVMHLAPGHPANTPWKVIQL